MVLAATSPGHLMVPAHLGIFFAHIESPALLSARQRRDKFLAENPPISRREVCSIIGRNNTSGIAGVYRYAKSYTLKNGKLKKCWYWEATWPVGDSRQDHIAFSMNEYGEAKARDLAVSTRNKAINAIEGV